MRKTEPVTTRAVATVPAQLLLTYIWSRNHTYIVATAPTMTGRVFNADSEFFCRSVCHYKFIPNPNEEYGGYAH